MDQDNPFTKSQTIDPEVRAYVYSLVNALGGTGTDETGKYVLGDDALAVLRDLRRWLKLYDEKMNRLDVARCLAEANLVRGDLLPILSTCSEDGRNEKAKARIALACFELLVPLTWPLEHEEMTVNHHRHTPFNLQSQVKYKAAVLHWETSAILRQAIKTAIPALAMQRDQRTSRDEGIIKLILYFIRNIAAIRQAPNLPSQGLDTEVSRSSTIEVFRTQDVFALLLTMCSNIEEDYNLMDVIILEIIFNLVKGVDVEKLWMDREQRTKTGIDDLKRTLAMEGVMNAEAKKKAWSRHGRFGTMIWVTGDEKQMKAVSGQDNLKSHTAAMFNIDNNKKWNKPLHRRKQPEHSIHDFDQEESLSGPASEQLRNFAEEFLDSGFNPLITHLRKAIEREAERLLPINYRQFFYVVAWFLKAERVRRAQKQKEAQNAQVGQEFEPESYSLVAAVLNQETFITINRYMQMSWDEKGWQDLNASMRCFTEILLTVQDMAQSPIGDDQEIAENIQNRIFYEETTHDRIRLVVQGYKDQGVGFLDACTELAHVFLRMLERYSKENVDLQIRSKRKARRARRAGQQARASDDQPNTENADEESEQEDMVDVLQVSKERKFDFKRFAAKFVTQSSVDTFVSLLKFHKDLSTEQLKRIHRFLYRVAFKQEQPALLYRIDIIALLYKMIEGPEGLPGNHPLFDEWHEFTKQLFKKMLKKVNQRPEHAVEILFSKMPSTLYYLEYGHDKQSSANARPPADLEVKNALARERSEQIGIVVTVLLRDDKEMLVQWLRTILNRAYEDRHAWETGAEARRTEAATVAQPVENETFGPPVTALELPHAEPSYISISPENDEIRIAMFKNARLKLLMKLVGIIQEVNDKADTPDATWIIPSHISASHLAESKTAIQQYSTNHWQPDNEDDNPEDFLRKARKATHASLEYEDVDQRGEAQRDNFIDDSEGDEILPEEEEFLFPDNPRQQRPAIERLKAKRAARKRKRASDDDATDSEDEAARAERRKRRQEAALERRRKFKSEAFIRNSDDESDEERDKAFFAKEAELRIKYAQRHIAQMSGVAMDTEMDEDALARRKKTVARLRDESNDEDEGEAPANRGEDIETESASAPSQRQQEDQSSVGGSDEESTTPPSSPPLLPAAGDAGKRRRQALKALAQGRAGNLYNQHMIRDSDDDTDSVLEGDGENIKMTGKAGVPGKRSRRGLVIDDEDSE